MTLTPSTVRTDLKCGKGSISKGEKCTKGAASKAQPKKREPNIALRNAALIGGAAATIGGLAYGVHKYNRVTRKVDLPRGATPEQQISVARSKFKDARGIGTAMQIGGAGLAATGAGLMAYGNEDKKKRGAAIGTGAALVHLGTGVAIGGLRTRRQLNELETDFNKKATDYTKQWYGAREQAKQRQAANEASGSQGSRNAGPNRAVPNPYKDLGVSETASDAELKKAWLKLMRENHPDVGGDPRKAQQINAAYQEIMRRRGKFDSMYADGFDFDLEDLGL